MQEFDPDVQFNFCNPNEHVPEIERSIQVIKERVRAAFSRLKFKCLPGVLIKILVMECTKKLIFFPSKNGVSSYYSPRVILHQRGLDYNKHCKYQFGSYVQAHDDP